MFTDTKSIEEKLSAYFIRRKSEIDKELDLYKRESSIAINEEIAKLHLAGNKQTNEYEHEFHQARQDKMSELARIDGEIAAKKVWFDTVLAEKEKVIAALLQALGYKQDIIAKVGQVVLDKANNLV